MTTIFRTISLPEHLFKVKSGSFDFEVRATGSDSILSGFVVVDGFVEMRWACQLELGTMERVFWQEFSAWRASLMGQRTLFVVSHPGQILPLGGGAGYAPNNPIYPITGTTLTGTTIRTGATTCLIKQSARRHARVVLMKALPANALIFKRGDVFGLGGNLYRVDGKVFSDANGECRVPFLFRLWKGAREGDIVTLRNPTCRMQLKTPNEGTLQLSAPLFGNAGFSAHEVPFL
jgi:hypothetical protein